jgi:3-oxoacyl-[acyl-carrier protein] reductase
MRNVIVTGGSRGLGLGIVSKLAKEGYRAIAIARNKTPELTALMQSIEETECEAGCEPQSNSQCEAGRVQFAPFDLADLEDIAGLVKKLRKEYGPIYGLVNNAGTSAEGTLAMMSISQMERVVRLNTLSPMAMTKYVVRSMMADGGGRIVNIASVVAFTGYSGLAVYSASKASLVGFTRSLAREVGKLGITVNAVAPGFVDTEMTQKMTDEQREQIVRRSALKRLVHVEDVANTVEFLLGHGAKNITGTVITVDAGSTA